MPPLGSRQSKALAAVMRREIEIVWLLRRLIAMTERDFHTPEEQSVIRTAREAIRGLA